MTAPVRPATARYTVQDYARALGIILQKEIGVPFVLYEVASGCFAASPETDDLETTPVALPPDVVQEIAQRGQADVRTVAPGSYQLTLVLYQANRPAVVAAGWFKGLAKTKDEAESESRWLTQWIHSVSERLRLSEQMMTYKAGTDDNAQQVKSAWEGLLAVDHVIRRLRLHKDPTKNLKRILETTFELLPVQSLICLPPLADAEPLIEGEAFLAPEDCRDLGASLAKSPDFKEEDPVFFNHAKNPPWGSRFPAIDTLLAFPILETPPYGWLIAVNKGGKDDAGTDVAGGSLPFRRSDAALLLPFVALMRLQGLAGGRFQELRELVVGLARSLTAAIDAKDSYTFGHSERVSRIALELGRALGLNSDELSDLYLAGLLHDVGKIGVPDGVLRKTDPLTPEEFESIKQHVTIGYAILADLRPIRHLLTGVLYHHERWDGKGYPEGLQGEKIPLLARILAVADAYDAMSTDRPYRAAVPFAEVEQRLQQGAGSQWDARIVAAFLQCRQKIHAIRQRGVGESLRQALDGALRSKGSTNVL
jgi:HD-GYP domain-containing protein (c-di-GMP phosphodiesterase class II)